MAEFEGKHLSDVIDYDRDIEPYRLVEIISGLGSGKNFWVENNLMQRMRVLLITSRQAKVKETAKRTGLRTHIDLRSIGADAYNHFWSGNWKPVSYVSSNWQIDNYMRNRYVSDDTDTHLFNLFEAIVIDEVHSLVTDATFADAPFYVMDFIRAAYRQSNCKIILMTATPEPLHGLIQFENHPDRAIFDFREECINLMPERLDYMERETALNLTLFPYKVNPHATGMHVVYFTPKIAHIRDSILPYLLENGVPEERIAVSFSTYDEEDCGWLSETLLNNKNRTENYLAEHETLPEDIYYFISTSKNKEGINIDDENSSWQVVIESHWGDEIKQMWGRIRNGIKRVIIVTDASQHVSNNVMSDFDYIFDASINKQINDAFDSWCITNGYPLKNRYHNSNTKKKILDLQQTRFPYIRYSLVRDKFLLYKGRVLGHRRFKKQIDAFDLYLQYWRQEIDVYPAPDKLFDIPSYLYFSSFGESKVEKFRKYVKENDLLGRPLSKEDRAVILAYITDELKLTVSGSKRKPYSDLSKAISNFGYRLVECSKRKEHKLYGYYRMEEIIADDIDL